LDPFYKRTADVAVRMSVCRGSRIGDGVHEYLERLHHSQGAAHDFWEESLDCVVAARDCEGVLTCIGIEASEACDPEEYAEHCEDGRYRTTCVRLADGEGRVAREDCRWAISSGPSCIEGETGGAACGVSRCEEDEASCAGDVATSCSGGVLHRDDCSNLVDGRCWMTPYEKPMCVQSTAPCTSDRCDGETSIRCLWGIEMIRFECAELPGLICVEQEGESGCRHPGEVCEDREGRCVGSAAEVCLAGRWYRHECSDFLDASCELLKLDEDDDRRQVRCRSRRWP